MDPPQGSADRGGADPDPTQPPPLLPFPLTCRPQEITGLLWGSVPGLEGRGTGRGVAELQAIDLCGDRHGARGFPRTKKFEASK